MINVVIYTDHFVVPGRAFDLLHTIYDSDLVLPGLKVIMWSHAMSGCIK